MIMRRTLLAALAASTFVTAPSFAGDTAAITVTDAFSRATAPKAKTGVVFLTVTAAADDKITGFTTPAANRPELHMHEHKDGVMMMRQVEAIELPAGEAVTLAPGGLHLMLIDLNGPLIEGETVDVTLMFEHADDMTLSVPVKEPGAME